MIPNDLTKLLTEQFGEEAVQKPSEDTWQVEATNIRLLVILSEDLTWLRLLVPLISVAQAKPYLEELLEANFDQTQWVRYGVSQGVLWGVFQHNFQTLTSQDCQEAIAQLIALSQQGIDAAFNQLVEKQIRQIIQVSKAQGQTLEATLQNLTRFYEEGMLGGLGQDPQEKEQFLSAWQAQLERLWEDE